MELQNNRFSVSEIIIIAIGVCSLFLLAEHMGWGTVITSVLGLFSSLAIIYVLLWMFKIKPLFVTDDNKKTIYAHLAILVIAFFGFIYSLLLIIFIVGSDALITGIAIITMTILFTLILILFPWPSWMKKRRNLQRS